MKSQKELTIAAQRKVARDVVRMLLQFGFKRISVDLFVFTARSKRVYVKVPSNFSDSYWFHAAPASDVVNFNCMNHSGTMSFSSKWASVECVSEGVCEILLCKGYREGSDALRKILWPKIQEFSKTMENHLK